jgi:hypothetical protein
MLQTDSMRGTGVDDVDLWPSKRKDYRVVHLHRTIRSFGRALVQLDTLSIPGANLILESGGNRVRRR